MGVNCGTVRDTGESAYKVRIGFLPDLTVQSLGAAAATAPANAPPV